MKSLAGDERPTHLPHCQLDTPPITGQQPYYSVLPRVSGDTIVAIKAKMHSTMR